MKKDLKIISFISIYIIYILIPTILIAQPLFEVERDSFCRSILNYEPVDVFSDVAEIRKGDGIYFWVEIRAGIRALSMLDTKGILPIYHAWASKIGISDIINVGIKNDVWIREREKIKDEVKKRGYFTWRTQSFKRNFWEGVYYVSVLDANKRPVKKSDSGHMAFRPEIIIRFLP